MIHVFTSIAENYLPKAIVLANSIRKFHPDWKIHLLVVQEELVNTKLVEAHFDEYHLIKDLNIDNFKPWAFCHTIVELSTAIKPFLMKKLMEQEDCTGVVYIDPDIVVFSKLTEIVEGITNNSIVLTPHQTEPEVDLSGVIDNEICSLKHGTYNLGFVAVANSSEGKKFAKWWSDRTYNFCRDEIPNGLFTDQKWIDLVPAIFEGVKIERSPRFNIATWNIRTRILSGAIQDGLFVNGFPVGFYHFSGFDSGAHEMMAKIYAENQNLLFELINWYKVQCSLIAPLLEPYSSIWPYGQFDDGEKIALEMRYVYRERKDLQKFFKDPFDTNSESNFKKWWSNEAKLQYPAFFSEKRKRSELKRLKENVTPGFVKSNLNGNSSIKYVPTPKYLVIKHKIGLFVKFPIRVIRLLNIEGIIGLSNRIS
jgi:hypothetical protein